MMFILQSCEPGVEFIATGSVWLATLLLARQYGWAGEGTMRADQCVVACGAARDRSVSGTQAEPRAGVADYEPERFGYDTHESLWVTPEDADALADAIERAIPEVEMIQVVNETGEATRPVEYFAGRIEMLRQFVAFSRHGPFCIR